MAATTERERRARLPLADNGRRRRIRVIRDYGMYDRRENPQYYPEVPTPDPGYPERLPNREPGR
jgi:hypothetical protein